MEELTIHLKRFLQRYYHGKESDIQINIYSGSTNLGNTTQIIFILLKGRPCRELGTKLALVTHKDLPSFVTSFRYHEGALEVNIGRKRRSSSISPRDTLAPMAALESLCNSGLSPRACTFEQIFKAAYVAQNKEEMKAAYEKLCQYYTPSQEIERLYREYF